MRTKYVCIEEPKLIVRYKGMAYSFDIGDIASIFITKKRIPYYGVVRILLIVLFFPMLVYCIRVDSTQVAGYFVVLYCLLLVFHDHCIYMLCIFTKDGKKKRIRIRQCEKTDFIDEVNSFLENYRQDRKRLK